MTDKHTQTGETTEYTYPPKHPLVLQNIENMPVGESLKNVVDRLNPFWNQYLANIKENLGNHLIVAHSNSLRAIVKILDQLSDKEIMKVDIPTGIPLVYEFDGNFNILEEFVSLTVSFY